MPKFFRNIATIGIMGIPCWVVLAAVFGEDPTSLTVRVDEPGVRVEIDGREYQASRRVYGPVSLPAGEHHVSVAKGEEVLYSRSVNLAEGERKVVVAGLSADSGRSANAGDSAARGTATSEPTPVLRGSLELAGHLEPVTGVGFSAEDRAVSVGKDRTLRFWDLNGGPSRRPIEAPTSEMKGLIVFGGGRKIATLAENGDLELREAETGVMLKRYNSGDAGKSGSMAASPDGKRIVVGSDSGIVRVVDLENGAIRKVLDVAPVGIGSLAFSPDGENVLVGLIASPQFQNDILVYSLKTDALVRRLKGHDAPVWGLSYLPNGRYAVSVGADRTMRLWDVAEGRELRNYPGQTGVGRCVAVSPDGRYAVAGTGYNWTYDGGWQEAGSYGVTVWDLEDDRAVGRFATSGPVRCLALSEDGRRALAGGDDKMVYAFELPDGNHHNTAISTNTPTPTNAAPIGVPTPPERPLASVSGA